MGDGVIGRATEPVLSPDHRERSEPPPHHPITTSAASNQPPPREPIFTHGSTRGRFAIRPVEGRPLDDTDSRLLERARHGDVRAYEELVRRYQDVAFRLAYTILGSAEEAEHATQ